MSETDKDSAKPDVAEKAIVWDDWFIDPKDDLVIVSNDDVHFRVSSFRMSQCSSVFKDMLRLPLETSSTTLAPSHDSLKFKPIELDYGALIIREFLNDACRPAYSSTYGHISDYEDGLARVRCVEQLDCPELLRSAWSDLASTARDKMLAFETLVMASERNNIHLAEQSMSWIRAEEIRKLYQSKTHLETQLARLQPDWAAWLRRRIFNTGADGSSVFTDIDEEWGWLEWGSRMVADLRHRADHAPSGTDADVPSSRPGSVPIPCTGVNQSQQRKRRSSPSSIDQPADENMAKRTKVDEDTEE